MSEDALPFYHSWLEMIVVFLYRKVVTLWWGGVPLQPPQEVLFHSRGSNLFGIKKSVLRLLDGLGRAGISGSL